jgi:predicted XRE-type DNA-binding protein
MKMKRYKKIGDFGHDLGLSKDQIEIAKLKTKIKKEILLMVKLTGLNPTDLAEKSGLARSVVSGIVNGSLQSVSIERLIKLAMALGLEVGINLKKAA